MNEDKAIEIMKDVAKEVAKEAYYDMGRPVLQPTGEVLGLVPRAIKAALSPMEKWILQKEYNVNETRRLLEQKLENTPPELIESPEPHIAVPALQYISYCMDNEELRDMYANLLANSMNSVVKKGVHPSFVEIIKQLSPDEAKYLKYFSRHTRIPTIDLLLLFKPEGRRAYLKDFSDIPQIVGCEYPLEGERYVDNLLRLGLLRRSAGAFLLDKEAYVKLKKNAYFVALKDRVQESLKDDERFDRFEIVEGFVELTAFGKSFCKICLAAED